jgi:hypothetical protein
MSKTLKAVAVNGRLGNQVAERPVLILEKQLMNALELQWHVEQVRIRSNGAANVKTGLLFEGIAEELKTFVDLIRTRLTCWSEHEPDGVEMSSSSYWRLFSVDSIEPREQFEALLCGYAHYMRHTSEAMTSLLRSGDLESSELLKSYRKLWSGICGFSKYTLKRWL